MSIYRYLLDTFNWRKYPENVFYIAGPLARLSFGLWLAVAVLHARQGEWAYLATIAVLMLVLGAFLRQAYRTWRITNKR